VTFTFLISIQVKQCFTITYGSDSHVLYLACHKEELRDSLAKLMEQAIIKYKKLNYKVADKAEYFLKDRIRIR
jgi:hypothetical protein